MTGTRTRERVVRTQVEPRLQERRQAVRDEARIRRRRGLAVVAVVAGVVGALVAAVFSPLLDVDEVRVAGADRLDAAELVAASGIEVGDRMISLELDQARDALRGLPGVRSARVEREWPSVVRITITEEEPAAMALFEDGHGIVATTGRLLDDGPYDSDGLLPLVVEGDVELDTTDDGREVPEDVLVAAMVLHRMDEGLRSQLASATLDEDRLLSFALDDGATVRFGPLEDLPAKLGAAEAVLAQVDPECWDEIDVREPSRVTVSRTCEGPPVTDSGVAPEQPGG